MLSFLVFEIFLSLFLGVPGGSCLSGRSVGVSGAFGLLVSVPGVFQSVPFRLLFLILQTPLCGFAKVLFGLSNLLTPVAVLNFLK